MNYKAFRAFMNWCEENGVTPGWDLLKVYIMGNNMLRIGPHLMKYNVLTERIEKMQ